MANATRVVTVFGTKGGVGKTTLATNLAAILQVRHHAKTAFLQLPGGMDDAGKMLGPTSVHRVTQPLTPATLPAALAELPSCAFVIVDAGSVLTELAVAAFEHSHLILLVATPDLIAIQHTNDVVRTLQSLNIPPRMLKVVLNRAESRGNFRSSEVAQHLAVDVIAQIPSDGRTVGLSANRGAPLVQLAPQARITDACDELAILLLKQPGLFVEQVTIDRAKAAAVIPPVARMGLGAGEGPPSADDGDDPVVLLKQRIHSQLVEELDLKRVETASLSDPRKAQELKRRVEETVSELLVREQGFIANRDDRARFVKEIVDEIMGMGPLEDLMADPEISDILVNGAEAIYVEKRGRLILTDRKFTSDQHLYALIERIIAPLGRRIDESTPMVDARLPDGSRVNAIIPPLSLKGPMLSIRKFSRERYTIEDLVQFGTLTEGMAAFLRACVLGRKNLIVSGGTGSGKTTLLNVVSSFIPDGERIVTIEDAAELKLDQRHWVALETRPPNIEGRGQITIRQLFRNALRMRPDRIIIGECRGDETLDMLQAMNTGHDGSLTTLHANAPRDVIARLDSLVLMSNVELPVRAIREQIASAVHLIVHTARLSDGSRKITRIAELAGMDEHADILFHDLFLFEQTGVDAQGRVQGAFRATGHRPSFLDELRTKGISLPDLG